MSEQISKTEREAPSTAEPKKELTPAQKQRRNKMLVMPLIFLAFAGAMWAIFAPPKKDGDKEVGKAGFNVELPSPTDGGMASDKIAAYEQEESKRRERDRMQSLRDFSAMFGDENETEEQRAAREERQLRMAPKPPEYYENPARFEGGGSSSARVSALKASAIAYDDMNRQLGAWNEPEPTQADNAAQSAMDERMAELERRLAETEAQKSAADEQTAMLEKSYEMAARYMQSAGNAGTATGASDAGNAADGSSAPKAGQSGKTMARPVKQVSRNVVSLLSAPMSDAEFIDAYSRPRNMGFLTAAGNENATEKNTIRACVPRTVTLTDGKELPIRLLEPMTAGNVLIPAGTVVVGSCRITVERMEVAITNIHHGGTIIPVELSVYDMDGQPGIATPNSDEANAMREVAASLAQSAGTSITISNDAGSQLAAEMGKGLIQGASQYATKKMSIVRVTVKAGHGLLLLPKTN